MCPYHVKFMPSCVMYYDFVKKDWHCKTRQLVFQVILLNISDNNFGERYFSRKPFGVWM